MSDENLLHPEALKAARKGAGFTQTQLAERIRCSKDTVSRWERGKSRRVRSHLTEPLCKTLKVKWEALTKPPEHKNMSMPSRRLQRWVSPHLPSALYLVAARFRVTPREVLDIAPLLFLIVAERSLLERRHRLDEINAILGDADTKLSKVTEHLASSVFARDHFIEDMLEQEEKSLQERDVFGQTIEYKNWCEDSEGPFLHFVRGLAKGLPQEAVISIDSSYGGNMIGGYQIADDTLRELTGVAEDEDDKARKISSYIWSGWIDLSECLSERQKRDEAGYRQWILHALSEAEEAYERAWPKARFPHFKKISKEVSEMLLALAPSQEEKDR